MAAGSPGNALPPAKRFKPDSLHELELAASLTVVPTNMQEADTSDGKGAATMPASTGRPDVLTQFMMRNPTDSPAGDLPSSCATIRNQRWRLMCSVVFIELILLRDWWERTCRIDIRCRAWLCRRRLLWHSEKSRAAPAGSSML